MSEFYDDLETRAPERREAALMTALAAHVAYAKAKAPYYAGLLAGIEAAGIGDRAALARLPVTRKSELIDLQRADPPFAGLTATPNSGLLRLFASPGPIYDPQGQGKDWWRVARALFAAGFRPGELVHNCFSYHFSPGGMMLENGAHALGCPVFPAGTGNTEQQVRTVADLRPAGYGGTPSFLKVILDKADEAGLDCRSLTKAAVSGEALLPAFRAALAERGVAVRQFYATADLGLIAYESAAAEGLIVGEGIIVEIVRPGTGDPVAEGEVGEVVVTLLNPDYPLVRFATGDLSAVLAGSSPCGRTNTRLKGWMGRADQTTKVKGLFVHPRQIADVAARHPGLGRVRLVVERRGDSDAMILHVETAEGGDGLATAIRDSLQAISKLKGEVVFHSPGALPNDGKVIDDQRS